jgi:hypothetical protein
MPSRIVLHLCSVANEFFSFRYYIYINGSTPEEKLAEVEGLCPHTSFKKTTGQASVQLPGATLLLSF